MSRHLDEYTLKQRVATATKNEQMSQQLSIQGLVFYDVERAELVEKLRASGYYTQ